MDELPREIREGLEAARRRDLKRTKRLRVVVGPEAYPIFDFGENGFSVDLDTAPELRGLVDIHDGARHLYQCLIVRGEVENGRMRYEFKRHTPVSEGPARDFVVDENAPVALIGR
ncbi:MAG: hypothetical protein D6801_08300 [Alphaproteobacteria bacterium]|nr:MAG: hypothetical protein D6801_08300 [Alphaproteobacteria bacterium]